MATKSGMSKKSPIYSQGSWANFWARRGAPVLGVFEIVQRQIEEIEENPQAADDHAALAAPQLSQARHGENLF
jgi:hypothetical protein